MRVLAERATPPLRGARHRPEHGFWFLVLYVFGRSSSSAFQLVAYTSAHAVCRLPTMLVFLRAAGAVVLF